MDPSQPAPREAVALGPAGPRRRPGSSAGVSDLVSPQVTLTGGGVCSWEGGWPSHATLSRAGLCAGQSPHTGRDFRAPSWVTPGGGIALVQQENDAHPGVDG